MREIIEQFLRRYVREVKLWFDRFVPDEVVEVENEH